MLDLSDLLEEFFLVASTSGSVVPTHVDRNADWFWAHEWQECERAANKDLRQKAFVDFATVDELITA